MIENILIGIGVLGALGSIMALAVGYAIHLSEQKEREWWANREKEWRERK